MTLLPIILSDIYWKICSTIFADLIDDEVGAFGEGAVPLGVVRPSVVVDVRSLGVRLAFLRRRRAIQFEFGEIVKNSYHI